MIFILIICIILLLCIIFFTFKNKKNISIINKKTLSQIQNEYSDKTIIDMMCNKCKCNYCYIDYQNEHGVLYKCINCHNLVKYDKLKETTVSFSNTIKCPYCNSTNIKKITMTSKVVNTSVFGLAAMNKVNSNWHCNNCKSDF